MAQKQIELDGALAGRHVIVERQALTLGFLEDMQSQVAMTAPGCAS
jgi:hypothetical protein